MNPNTKLRFGSAGSLPDLSDISQRPNMKCNLYTEEYMKRSFTWTGSLSNQRVRSTTYSKLPLGRLEKLGVQIEMFVILGFPKESSKGNIYNKGFGYHAVKAPPFHVSQRNKIGGISMSILKAKA